MCTVLLRFDPAATWPILLAAVRDEFVGRAWDGPGRHWPELPRVIGGRDRVAGGTWMAVDPSAPKPSVAALLNGVPLGDLAGGEARPTRGRLVLAALSREDGPVPGVADRAELRRYDGFHLLRADADGVEIWCWDGIDLSLRHLATGDHIVVNLGADREDDPLVPHFRPILAAARTPSLVGDSTAAWADWTDLLRGDGLAADDPRGLIIEQVYDDRSYGSTSASLVAIGRNGDVRYDFTATPAAPAWQRVDV